MMFPTSHRLKSFLLLALGLAAAPSFALAAPLTMDVYISPPGVTTSPITGAVTETFDSLPVGLYPPNPFPNNFYDGFTSTGPSLGTYVFASANAVYINPSDQYGGAGPGGSNYLAFGAQSQNSSVVTLNLASPQNYFGFWWSAGDVNNGIAFYSGNEMVASFSTVDVLGLLNSEPPFDVMAGDGQIYNTASYKGKPANNGAGSGQNTGEPYAYISFVGTDGTFDRIVFNNNGSAGTGFESDNHTIYSGTIDNIPSAILISNFVPVPEPSTLLLGGLAMTGGAFAAFRKLRRRRAS